MLTLNKNPEKYYLFKHHNQFIHTGFVHFSYLVVTVLDTLFAVALTVSELHIQTDDEKDKAVGKLTIMKNYLLQGCFS